VSGNESFIDQPSAVRDGESIDVAKLESYLAERFFAAGGGIRISQFPAGYSNLTYLLRVGDREMVLRRPPFGNPVRSAHDMEREFRVLSALSPVYRPAPRPYLYCDDKYVIGDCFYLMERRRGIILRKAPPRGLKLEPPMLRRLSESFAESLADLHALDFQQIGLASLGEPAGFIARQVAGWTRRYRQAQTDDVPDMDSMAQWLEANTPTESGASLIHNDYKYDNLVLDPADPTRIIAVLDWEMATLGDPLMDLGCSLAYWVEAGDPAERIAAAFAPTYLPGSLTRREIVEHYAARSGRAVPNMTFYYGYGLFKLAVIVQQIYARYQRGHTRDPRFAELDRMVTMLAETARQAAGI
jgi:aminoglycoside phosphotransferase (APT) family kinase protein